MCAWRFVKQAVEIEQALRAGGYDSRIGGWFGAAAALLRETLDAGQQWLAHMEAEQAAATPGQT